ncbi:MAG: protein kinase domain-containing protein [Promethearchaeota archaeon]
MFSNQQYIELFKVGDIIEDKSKNCKYKIIERLGGGGFGTTYKIKLVNSNSRILVAKTPVFQKDGHDDYRINKLKNEAHIVKLLKDANISNVCEYYDFIENVNTSEGYVPVFIMEFSKGITLTDFCSKYNGIDEQYVKQVIIKIGETLTPVHKKGIIHRDLKPDNIMIEWNDMDNEEPDITIIDFGISALFNFSDTFEKATRVGTNFFSPPEQIFSGIIGPSTDIFSLAAIAFYMLTGKILQQRSKYDPSDHMPASKSVSERFAKVIKKATWPQMEKRFATVDEFINAVRGQPPDNRLPRIIIDGNVFPIRFFDGKSEIIIGRKNSTKLVDFEIEELTFDNNYYISRQHCRIKKDAAGHIRLYDCSKNGTYFRTLQNDWIKIPSSGLILGSLPLVIGLGFSKTMNIKDINGNPIKPGAYKIIEYRPPEPSVKS